MDGFTHPFGRAFTVQYEIPPLYPSPIKQDYSDFRQRFCPYGHKTLFVDQALPETLNHPDYASSKKNDIHVRNEYRQCIKTHKIP